MKTYLKKGLSYALALLLALGSAPALAAEDEKEFFPPIKIDGITYYDVLGSIESNFDSDYHDFLLTYMQSEVLGDGALIHPSSLEQWGTVAEEIIAASKNGDAWDRVHGQWAFGSGRTTTDHYGTALSVNRAYHQARTEDYGGGGGYVAYQTTPNDQYLSDTTDLCVYYFKRVNKKNAADILPAYQAYAVIANNFQLYEIVDGEYLNARIEEQTEYDVNVKDTSSMIAQQFTNETPQAAQISAQITSSASETLTLSQKHSQTTTKMHSLSFKATTGIGGLGNHEKGVSKFIWKHFTAPGNQQSAANLEFGYSYTWGTVTGEEYSMGHSIANTLGSSATMSAALPPYTQASILQSMGKASLDYDFHMPLMMTYDVTIVYFSAREGYNSYALRYEGSESRGTRDARHDLYRRAIGGITDPDGVSYSTDTLLDAAVVTYSTVPFSKANFHMAYEADFKMGRLSEISPIRNLKRLELTDKRTTLALAVGEPLDVSTIGVSGLNAYSVPYFGFDANLGSWMLTDMSGREIDGNANEYMKLEKDTVTGKLTLTALAPGGTAVLKYQLPDNTYVNVEQTPIDAEETIYIHPENVENQATLIVRTTQDTSGYSLTAEGGVSGCVGDEAAALNGEGSPVRAWARDASGAELSVPVTWRVRYANGTISIDGENRLSFLKAGENQIRAEWGSLHSDWLPVTVREPQRLASLSLSDPSGILDSVRVSTESSAHTYDLDLLSLSCLDQYGEAMGKPEGLVWIVTQNGREMSIEDPNAFSVTESGEYRLRAAAGNVSSNALVFSVAPRVTGVRLNLEEYTMSAGETMQLTAEALPEGEPDTFAYESSRPGVALVDAEGRITAIQAGTAVITAASRANPAARAQCSVTVVNPPEGLTLSPGEILLTVGETARLSALVSPEGTPATISFTTGNESVVSVNGLGEVTGEAPGTSFIRARTHNGLDAFCTVKVVEAPGGLDVPDALRLGVGETHALAGEVRLRSRSLSLITYLSMDPETAVVDEYGLVTAMKRGETAIIVTGPGGIARQVSVTVLAAPERIGVSPAALPMISGDRTTLVAELPEDSAGAVSFASSDPRVALVSQDGTVTALSAGETVITATAYNGASASCTITNSGVTEESRALRLPAALRTIGSGAFTGSPARIIFLPDGSEVKSGAFVGCGDLLLVVTKDASGIEDGAFDHEVLLVESLE